MSNQYSTIQLSRNKSYDYIHPIVYKNVSTLLYKEEFGVNQSCKFNHLMDYYYLIELLTQIKRKVDFVIENDCCYTYKQIKDIYTKYGVDCAIKCFACHNLPVSELLKAFDIDTNFVKDLDNKYLLQYEIQFWGQDLIAVKNTNILLELNSNYTLNIVNPDVDLYEYMSLQKDDVYIIPPTNSVTINNVTCNHKIVAKFKLIGCTVAAPTVPVITLSGVQQTQFTATWLSVGQDVTYLVELIENGNTTQSYTQTLLTRTFSGLLPSSDYTVKVTATNCAGTINSTIVLQTAPFLVIVNVVNGTSSVTGTNTVAYNSTFVTDFTSTGANSITSVKVNNITIPNNQLNITGLIGGIYPQTGTYTLSNITEDKYVEIIYSAADVCSLVNTTYNSLTNTITIQ